MLIATIATILALQAGAPAPTAAAERPLEVQYRDRGVPRHPPPCGDHWDLSARDGMCYPNGYLRPEDQAAMQGYYQQGYAQPRPYYGTRRRPVPCTDGADLDTRDGRCYPNGTVPDQFQNKPYYRRY
ncbi:hypothetical protein [Bradyrhizobium sp. 930_D9_N1_4]|uniref:hypothetical protein n=1 Tax=Bradyrhizobium sp. 930_D9_N1_4 TaxID=3240374 RepID=UPI003F89F448